MESTRVAAPETQSIREDELEILIAKYTLEYLHHWTNEFDAGQLAQFKRLFDNAGTAEALVNLLKRTRQSKPN
jgi:hypothetical protein